MYHAIVKRIALQNFLRVNQKDYTPILKGCCPDVHHRFAGHHALGSERHDCEALGRWFDLPEPRKNNCTPRSAHLLLKLDRSGPWGIAAMARSQDLESS